MNGSLYQASLPVLIHSLQNLAAILKKAESYAESKKITPEVLLNARLAPDMFPLVRQVQIATDNAKGFAARVAGVENPSYADTEKTFLELQARLAKTIDFLKSISEEQINAGENTPLQFKVGPVKTFAFKDGWDYLSYQLLPNFYFHVTTAYAILRHNGLDLTKGDYLNIADRVVSQTAAA